MEDAPFGLTWGQSVEEVEELGVYLVGKTVTEYGVRYSSRHFPKMVSDVERVSLYFGFNDKLWRVFATSKKVKGDPTAQKLLGRYNTLARLLAEKYGPGEARHIRHENVQRDPVKFLGSLKRGTSQHFTKFRTATLEIVIGLEGSDDAEGYYALQYENLELEKALEANKADKDKEAL